MIPAAVLYLNPGITKEEFTALLDETHCTRGSRSKYANWSSFGDSEDLQGHSGLYSAALILRLGYTEEYKSLLQRKRDENGFVIHPPSIFPEPYKKKGKWGNVRYIVTIHERNEILSESMEYEGYIDGPPVEGNIYGLYPFHYEQEGFGVILELHEPKKTRSVKRKVSRRYEETAYGPLIKARILKYNEIIRTENILDLETLVQKYPNLHPERMYDFSQGSGKIYRSPFRWVKQGDKYYLDVDFTANEYQYSDLIVTSEGIRRKAWKIFSYIAGADLEQDKAFVQRFLKAFPEAEKARQKGIVDYWFAAYANQRLMSSADMLRLRAMVLG